ncbi:NAD-dependent epimerase/dehydratase family protein [Fulvivirga sedimenti]|uniref:NAD-dependent epimerase/dehydratase family protein n=1 Tax=Fulvivirga sedimenti TaxID=2879465 RepID=A0A9X1HK92_9BACT|nr:NAD-dependent epimerase/dehydratase family protein [Fulvivirga sedimenti]MCA6073734.1 NAD-dependent epimerase/dehydratase family protein [Fulvivirga sedimenti]
MQTILGSGGAISTSLAKALTRFTKKIRLVSRNPKAVNESDEIVAADLTNAEQTSLAVEGSEVVYLVAGLQYDISIWREKWPLIMRNVINACEKHGSKLVFFDNIYMYDPNSLYFMTEETPVNPSSKKGMVRKKIAEMVLQAHKDGRIEALIARSADFYGPGIDKTSMLNETVIKPLAQGKKANWMGGLNFKHSFTYTPDAGAATALLGNAPSAYGQVWHLPTASEPPTGKEWVEMTAAEFGVKPRVQAAPGWLISLIGLFNPLMRELAEMMYQYDRDYVFSSAKFEEAFDMQPTPYKEGLRKVIQHDHKL